MPLRSIQRGRKAGSQMIQYGDQCSGREGASHLASGPRAIFPEEKDEELSAEEVEVSEFKEGTGWGGEVTRPCKPGLLHRSTNCHAHVVYDNMELCDSVT